MIPRSRVRPLLGVIVVLLSSIPAAGQVDLDAPQDYIANTITFPLRNPPQPVDVSRVSIQLLDNPGPATYCYWIVSNFTVGNSSPAGPVCTTIGPNTLVNGNRVSWAPVFGSNTFDVLRTSTATPPSGACGCAIATAVNGLQATDTGLNAYTVSTFVPNQFNLVWSNESSAAGVSQFVLRANGVIVYTITSSGALGISTLLLADGSAASPSFAFSSQTGTGMYRDTATGHVALSVSGTKEAALGNGWVVPSGAVYDFSSTADPNAAVDTGLSRIAAATVAVGNGSPGDSSGTVQATIFDQASDASLMFLGGFKAASTKVYGWTAGSGATAPFDTGLSRTAAAIVAVGNGTTGDFSGTLKATTVNAVTGFQVNGTALAAANLSNGTTGSGGGVVLATSPTITTPSISSPTITGTASGNATLPQGMVTPGTNGQCLITSGGVSAWGTCAGLASPQSNTTSATVNAASTGVQTIQTVTFAANTFNAIGKMFTVDAGGTVTPSATTVIGNIGFTVNGQAQNFTPIIFTLNSTNAWNWSIHAVCVVTTSGAAAQGDCTTSGTGFLTTSTTTNFAGALAQALVNFGNLTGSTTIQSLVQFNTSSTSNTATGIFLSVVPNN